MSTRQKLLNLVAVIPTEEVEIKGVGTVTLRGLNAGERDRWEQYIHSTRDEKRGVINFRASLVCRTILDEGGARAYTDSTADLDEISTLPAAVVDKLFTVSQRLSGLGAEADALEKI